MLRLIVCVDKEMGIGKSNQVPWKISEEMQHFKRTTIGSTVVMGRKTYDSIGKALPQRRNIVFTRNSSLHIDGVEIFNDKQAILEIARTADVFIIGGAQIYKLFENDYDEMIISKLDQAYDCDVRLSLNMDLYSMINIVRHEKFTIEYYKSKKNKILDGKATAIEMQKTMIIRAQNLIKKFHAIPQLVIIQVGSDFASDIYVKNKVNLGKILGIKVIVENILENDESMLEQIIQKYNEQSATHGILVQLPLPKMFNENKIMNMINPIKDVDCFNPINIGKFWISNNHENLATIPCTPLGIIKLLDAYNINLTGKKVVVIGRSNIVGKPLINLCLQANATVQICHSHTQDLVNICQQADVLVVAIGKPKMITEKYVKNNAVVIDVGINRDTSNKICGDVDFDRVFDRASFITPVPGGIGPMTLIMLFHNLLNAYEKQFE